MKPKTLRDLKELLDAMSDQELDRPVIFTDEEYGDSYWGGRIYEPYDGFAEIQPGQRVVPRQQ